MKFQNMNKPDPKPTEIPNMTEKQKKSYDMPELQSALEEILKELEKYKVKSVQNEGKDSIYEHISTILIVNHIKTLTAVYWSTLISQSIPNWALVEVLEGILTPLKIVDQSKEEEMNQAAIAEIMGDLNKKATREETEGVSAWKTRQKVDKMFLARTIKVIFVIHS